jgi:hypothetical protein
LSLKRSNIEERRLKRLIKEYQDKGYEIIKDYKDLKSGFYVRNFQPDLIVKKGDEVIISEIVTKESLNLLRDKLEYLSNFSEKKENVRFDIIFTNPKPRLSKEEQNIANAFLLNELESELLKELKKIYNKRDIKSFLILHKSLFKHSIRSFAIKKKVIEPNTKININEILIRLLDYGYINKENYEVFNRILKNVVLINEKQINYNDDKNFELLKHYNEKGNELKYILDDYLKIIEKLL